MTRKEIAPCSGWAGTARERFIASAMNVPNVTFKSAAENPKPDRRACLHETADGYARTLARSGLWRVIRCRDDLQFVVQKRAGRAKARPWQAVAFIRDAKARGTSGEGGRGHD